METLPDGHYYVQYDKCSPFIKDTYGMLELIRCVDSEKIEVLAPVPDYKMFQFLIGEQKFTEEMLEDIINIRTEELLKLNAEYIKTVKKLEKRLAIATKALKETKEKLLHVELSGLDGNNRQKMYDLMFEDGVIDKALKEMEGVK